MTKKGFNFKTRFVALILSVLTLVSVFTVAATVNVSAAETNNNVVSTVIKSKAAKLINKGIDNIIDVCKAGNPYMAAYKLLTGAFSLYLDATDESPSTKDIMDRLDALSSQMSDYFNQEKALLDKIDLKIDEKQFKDCMNELMSYNKQALVVVKSQLDDDFPDDEAKLTEEKLEEFEETLEELCEATPSDVEPTQAPTKAPVPAGKSKEEKQKDVYRTVINASTGNSSYTHTANMVGDAIQGSSVYGKAFELYLQELKKSTDNADETKEQYERFIDLCMGQYVFAYTVRLTGYTAETKLYTLEDNQAELNRIKSVTDAEYSEFQMVTEEFKNAKAELDNIEKCVLTIGDKETAYNSFADAWVDATKASGNVTLKLSQDIVLDSGQDFLRDLSLKQSAKECFKDGNLYVENKDLFLTIDLNGHKLGRVDSDYTLQVNNTHVLVKSGNLDCVTVKADENYHSYELELKDLVMDAKKGTAINGNKGAVVADNVTVDGYTNSGVKIYYVSSTFTNCSFKNNHSSGNGGALYNNDTRLTLTSCDFFNNSADKDGGGLYTTNSVTIIDGCAFRKNTARNGGGAWADDRVEMTSTNFFDNKATGNGGGLMSDYYGYGFTATVDLASCSFSGNDAGKKGGAVYADSMTYAKLSDVKIYGNTSGEDGAGFYCSKGSASSCDPDLHGLITIDGNKKHDGTSSNLFLGENTTSKCIVHCHDMSKDSKIGVTSNTTDKTLDITGKESDDFARVFFYDTNEYHTHGYGGFFGGHYVEIVKN